MHAPFSENKSLSQAARARMALPKLLRAAGWLALAAAVVVIALIPLGYAIDAQFYRETKVGLSAEYSLAAARDVYLGAEYWWYLASALILAGLVTLFSLVAGVLLAFLVGRTDLKRKSLWDMAINLPLYLSPFTGLMAWIALGSEKTGFVNGLYTGLAAVFTDKPRALINIWSYGGVVFVMFLFFCPFVYLFTVGSLRAMNGSLEEAARTSGASPLQTIMRITLPICSPSILASGLLVFVLTAETYTIPGIIGSTAGFTVLPWKIFEDSVAAPVHRAHAAAGGTMLLFVTIAGVWLQRRFTRVAERFVTVGGKGSQTPPIPLGRWKPAALALILAYVLAADVLPFGALLTSSLMKYSSGTLNADIFTSRHYEAFFTTQNMLVALWNTVFPCADCGCGLRADGLRHLPVGASQAQCRDQASSLPQCAARGGAWPCLRHRPRLDMAADACIWHGLDIAHRLCREIPALWRRHQPHRAFADPSRA